jgi:Fe-S cluster biogenesis protein NfuA
VLLDLDEARAAVHLRLLGSCDGCPSSAVTLKMAVEQAIAEAAPEIVVIDVEQPTTEVAGTTTPVELGRRSAVAVS